MLDYLFGFLKGLAKSRPLANTNLANGSVVSDFFLAEAVFLTGEYFVDAFIGAGEYDVDGPFGPACLGLRVPEPDPGAALFTLACAALRRLAPYMRFTPSTYAALAPPDAFLRAAAIPADLMLSIVAWLTLIADAFFDPDGFLYPEGCPPLVIFFMIFPLSI
jgi:hypothetical protein